MARLKTIPRFIGEMAGYKIKKFRAWEIRENNPALYNATCIQIYNTVDAYNDNLITVDEAIKCILEAYEEGLNEYFKKV